MVFILPALFVLSLFGIRFQKCNAKENTYLTKNSTNAIRGIFIILIAMALFLRNVTGTTYTRFDNPLFSFTSDYVQLLFVPFFFYSGFGIFETYKNLGREYARKIPLQQILRHFLSYFISWILFAVTALAIESNYSIQDYLLSSIGLSTIGNSNWFVFVMIFLYLISFVSFRIADKKTAVIIHIILVLFLYFMLKTFAQPGSEFLWNTMPAYVFGVAYSYLKERIEKFIFKKKFIRYVCLVISLGALIGSIFLLDKVPYSDFVNAMFLLPSLFLCATLIFTTSIFRIQNKVLNFIGSNHFWIYILFLLPTIWFKNIGFITKYSYVYFIISFIVALALGFIFNKIFNYFWNIFAKNHGKTSEESNIQLGIVISYITLFVSAIGAFVVTPRVLENLGDTQYGLLSFANSITAWLTVITSALAASYIRFASKYKKEHGDVGIVNTSFLRIFGISALAMLLLIGIGVAVFLGFGIKLSNYTAEENRLIMFLILISGINVSLNVLFSVFNNFLTYNKQFIFIRLLALGVSFLTFTTNLIFSFVTKNVLSISICAVVITSISSFLTVFFAVKNQKMTFAKVKYKETSPLIKSIITFSSFILLNAIVDQINSNLDKTLLGLMVNAEAVTDYTLAKYFNAYFMTISIAISSTYVPKIHELVANNDKKELSALFLKISRSQMAVMFLVGGGFFACGKEFMNIWLGADKEYIYYYALIPVALDTVALTVNSCIEIQRAMNKHKFRAILYVCLAVVNVALSILLIKILPTGYEIWGAFIGTAFSVVMGNLVILNIYNHRKIGLPMLRWAFDLFKHIAYAAVGVGVAFVINHFYPNTMGISLKFIIEGLAFVAIYFGLLMIFERKHVIPLIKKIAAKIKGVAKAKQN